MKALRFKQFLRERNQFSRTGEETLLSVSEYYGVKPRREAFQHEEHESRAASLEGYRIVQKDDLVMNYMLAWKGAYGVSDHDGIVSPAYSVFEVDTQIADVRYLHHRVRSDDMKDYFRSRSKGIIESRLRLYPDSLLASYVKLPDLDTQRQIADFLDRETGRIDLLIQKKQRLVKLLAEKRLALISRSTITGLNPDAEMRSSGVAWIGNIPKHWSMMPIKYLVSKPLIDGPHVTPVKREEGVTFISAEAISGGRIDFGKKWGFISEEDHKTYSKRYKPQRDDLFVVKLGATTGRIARVETDGDFNIWVPLAAIRPQNATLSKHIYYALQSRQVNDGYQMLWTYGTQQTLGLGTLSNLRIPVPPKAEMEEISKRLDEQLPRFDNLKEKALQSIDRLKEYRAALITAAVTGQIDVASHSRSGATERTLDTLQEEMDA